MEPFVTVLIPTLNEGRYIRSLLENIIAQDYPANRLEVFIIDGLSNDRTGKVVEEYHQNHPNIQLLLNERKFVPFALNAGIKSSRGEVIIRMDAHSRYPENYISRLVKYLFELSADNVGGIWVTKPANDSRKAISIAVALSSVFGVGDAHYRLGTREIRKVDTVPFGCFRKSLFCRIGLFDEELLRNQDDEFNARILENGGSIYLIPDLEISYFARPDISSLAKMFYQYGFFKPLVNSKLKKPASIRQFVPPLFVLFLTLGWAGIFILPELLIVYGVGLGLYLLSDIFFTFREFLKHRKRFLLIYLPWIFFVQHISYGFGYLAGIVNFVFVNRSQTTIKNSR